MAETKAGLAQTMNTMPCKLQADTADSKQFVSDDFLALPSPSSYRMKRRGILP